MPTKFLNLSTDTTLGGSAPSDTLAVSQKAIKTYVDNHGGGGSVAIDNSTITKNASDEIQAVAVIDQNTGIAKTWTGTQAEYDAIVAKDPETEYIITDDIGLPATEIGEITEALNGKADVSMVAHVVIEFQAPTSANNYTWYRLYADGWVEQGGNIDDGTSHTEKTINLPVTMANTMYNIDGRCVNDSSIETGNDVQPRFAARTTTTVKYRILVITGNSSSNGYVFTWQVSGMAA